MKELKLFEGQEVEIIVGKNGEPLFELYSTGKALGYARWNGKRTSCAPQKDRIENIVKNAEISIIVHGGQQYLTESDLYDFIFEAKTEKSRPFRKWVTNEVLPTIRKYGMYAKDELLNNPDLLIEVATQLKAERQARVESERRNAILMHTKKTYTATEIAKELGFKSAAALNKDLCDREIQYKVNNTYVLKSDYSDLGYTSIKQQILDNGKEVYSRHFTQDGRNFVLNLYRMQEKAN